MTGKNAGFTLIELLVVVLIIGILAAIALPQYEIAVAKSRAGAMLPLAKAVLNAQQAFFMANGRWATTWDELDVEMPTPISTTPVKTSYDIETNYWTNVKVYDHFQAGIRMNDDKIVGMDFILIDTTYKSLYGGKGFRVGVNGTWGIPQGRLYCWEHALSSTHGSFCEKMQGLGDPIQASWHGTWWLMD